MPWRCGDGWQRAVNLQPVCTLCVPLTNSRLHLGCSGTQAGCGQSQPVLVERAQGWHSPGGLGRAANKACLEQGKINKSLQ